MAEAASQGSTNVLFGASIVSCIKLQKYIGDWVGWGWVGLCAEEREREREREMCTPHSYEITELSKYKC